MINIVNFNGKMCFNDWNAINKSMLVKIIINVFKL